jgi:dTDP-4-dehydrorhamnose reductase
MRIGIVGNRGQLGWDVSRVMAPSETVIGVDLPELDFTDGTAVADWIDRVRPDVVVNCAAFTAVDRCETEPEAARLANVEGPRNLARAIRECGAGQLIHISTDYVFDGQRPVPEPYRETDPTGPRSVYGESKLAGEQAVTGLLPSAVIIRTAWLYGINGPNFLKAILKRALAGQPLKVVNDQFGCPTWSYRLALQIQALIKADIRGIVHATGEGYCSWYDLARHFLDAMQIACPLTPCTTADYPTPARRPHNSILENRVLKTIGANIMADWRVDLDAFVRDHKDQLLAEFKEPQ